MRRIWGRANSSNVQKVLWTADALGLPYERVDAGGAFGRTKEPGYLAINPNALVPTLEEPDGFTLWESNAIMRYLVRAHAPGSPLFPDAPQAAADVERWMDWQLASITRPMTTIFFTHVRIPEPQRDWAAEAQARAEAGALWTILDARLAGRAHVCGEALTLADMALSPYIHRWYALPIERPALPNLAAWHARLGADPLYARHVAIPLT